jgi:hypothetical protein
VGSATAPPTRTNSRPSQLEPEAEARAAIEDPAFRLSLLIRGAWLIDAITYGASAKMVTSCTDRSFDLGKGTRDITADLGWKAKLSRNLRQ